MTTDHSLVKNESFLFLLYGNLGNRSPKLHNMTMLFQLKHPVFPSFQAVCERAADLFNMADCLPHSDQQSRLTSRCTVRIFLDLRELESREAADSLRGKVASVLLAIRQTLDLFQWQRRETPQSTCFLKRL